MFDPTAFENIKVVIEGEIYDRDLNGEIEVVDRNDWTNTAKLSRKYEISFRLPTHEITATMTLEAGLENLAAELMGHINAEILAGCKVIVEFSMAHPHKMPIYRHIQKAVEEIWGKEWAIEQIARTNPLKNQDEVENKVMIGFNRLVYEDQISDLSTMVDYMLVTLDKLMTAIKA